MAETTVEKKTRGRKRRGPLLEDDEVSGGGLGNLGSAMDALMLPSERPPLFADDEAPDFDGDQEVLDTPRLFRPAPGGRETRARSSANERVSNDFADILEDLEFGVDAHKISVFRLEPEYDPETGNKLSGLQATYSRPITLEDIQSQFGGGLFRIVVRGPREASGRGSEIKAQRVVEIAGSPIPLPDPRQEARKKRQEEEREAALVETLLSREDKRAEEARREAMELRRELAKKDDTMLQLLARASESKPDPTSTVMPLIEAMREEARRREEQTRLEMQRLEMQRKEEREEQRRRDEDARRQHEIEMQRQQQAFAMQMKQLEMQMQAQQSRVSEEAKLQQANMQLMVQFLTKADADKETRNAQAQQLQMAMMQQMNELQRTSMEGQMRLIMEQLKEAKSKDDFFTGLEKFQALRDLISPPEHDDRETWEKVLDRVGEAVPAVVGLAAQARGAVARPAVTAVSAPQAPPRPAMPAPGTVVVLEDELPPPARALPQQPAPASATVEEDEEDEDMDQVQNPMTEFPAQYQGKGNAQVLTELVYRLDLAVQQGLEVDQAFAKTLEPLPKMQKAFLLALDADSLVEYLEENVPAEWALRSVAGEQLVRDLHARLIS